MLSDGYAAVSSRSIAAKVGINAPLVHYYFPTLDDIFVAVLNRRAERNVERMAEALDAAEPLVAWWELASDPRGTALFVELLAAANHRPALKTEVGAVARDVRRMQVERLGSLLEEYGLDADQVPPVLFAVAMQGIAFSVVSDGAAGYDTSPAEAGRAMRSLLVDLEERRARRRT